MLQSLSFAIKRPQKYRKKEWWFGHDYWHKRNMSFIALSYWYNADNQRKQKQRWWKIISLWHRYDWYHTLVIMEIRSKRPNTKKATHTWMWMAMDVNNVKVSVCLDLWKWNMNYSFLESMGVPIMSSERLIWMASAAAFFFASTILA